MEAENRRVRAWVFVTAKAPMEAAEAIARYFPEGGDEYVIVRADVVEGGRNNLVVPVDAANEEALKQVLELINDAPGMSEMTVFRAVAHYPDPPHGASTFVTPEELEADYAEEYAPPGRHPKSPGRNAWG